MERLTDLLHSKQVPLQVVYDGSGVAPSDRVWVDQAEQRFKAFEGSNGLKPDGVRIQFDNGTVWVHYAPPPPPPPPPPRRDRHHPRPIQGS